MSEADETTDPLRPDSRLPVNLQCVEEIRSFVPSNPNLFRSHSVMHIVALTGTP